MAAELETPRDELSGLPLPILLPADFSPQRDPTAVNWHHHFHPSSASELRCSLGGKALRSARLQLVPADLHNDGKHTYHTIFKGPELPAANDSEKQFWLCVLACAGYVPRQAIDVRSDSPDEPVELTLADQQRYRAPATPQMISQQDFVRFRDRDRADLPARQVWRALEVRHKRQAALSYQHFRYSYDPIRDFFREFILQREIDISPKLIKRFLGAADFDRKHRLGETILARAADQATLSFRSQYQVLHQSAALHPLMPIEPDKLVFHKLGDYRGRQQLLPRLQEVLADSA